MDLHPAKKKVALLILKEEVVYIVLQLSQLIVRFLIFRSFQSSMKLSTFINQLVSIGAILGFTS